MRLTLVFLLLLTPLARAADGTWLIGLDIPLEDTAWQVYGGDDYPAGAWRGSTAMADGTNFPPALITWPSTLPAGTNYFLLKVLDYSGSNGVWFISGAFSNYVGLNNSDWNKYYCDVVPVNFAVATNFFQMRFVHQPGNIANDGQVIPIVIYITTNRNENCYAEGGTGYDRVIDYTWPATLDGSAAVKGNLVENGGFEVGITHGWGINPNSSIRNTSVYAMWDTNVSHDGVASLHVPDDVLIRNGSFNAAVYQAVIESKPFKLATNRQYTISVWTKETAGQNGTLRIRNPISVPTGLGYSNQFDISTTITANTSWHRTSITTNFYCYPTDDFQIELTVSTNTWIDSVQVEEGGLTDYLPSRPVELGVVSGRVGNLFTSDETVTLPLYGYSTNTGSHAILWQAYDWQNESVGSGSASLSLASNVLNRVDITPNIGLKGVFRFLFWAAGQPACTEEAIVVIAPYITPTKTNLYANTTASPADYQMDSIFDSGMRMSRAMSAFQAFNAAKAGSPPLYFDSDVAKFTNAGVGLLATLYNDNNPPLYTWWPSYVSNMVHHYKDRIHHWEILNEPLYIMGYAAYTDFLICAATNIRAGDPTAFIVGLGGVHDAEWSSNVFYLLSPVNGYAWTNTMDIASTHMYPYATSDTEFSGTDAKAAGYRAALSQWNPPIWNTEAGSFDQGTAVFNANYLAPGTALSEYEDVYRFVYGLSGSPEIVLKNALRCFAWGQSKQFYYDDRSLGTYQSYFRSHTTGWEYDDSRKTKVLALDALNSLIGEATGRLKLTNVHAAIYLFTEGANSWATLWSATNNAQTITLANTTLLAYDTFANAQTMTNYTGGSSTLLYGSRPVYIKGPGINISTFSNLVWNATITNLTDTTPPNLSIDVAPRTQFAGDAWTFRWLALDEGVSQYCTFSTKYDDGAWTEWSGYITRKVEPITSGPHTFTVAARDSVGNAVTNSVTFNNNATTLSIRSGVTVQGGVTIR